MIQAQKHPNWLKFHLKILKESKICIIGTRQIFFKILKILKMNVGHQINQSKPIFFDFSIFAIFID
jgi:hypothetical protein